MSSVGAAKPNALERVLVNAVLVAAVVYALYPVLWVVSLAFSSGEASEARALPFPHHLTLDHFRSVTGFGDAARSWLFARQLMNSLVVSFATAAVAVAIATPAAYALARFEFVGKRSGQRTLLMTQMFPGVASAVPLYLILDALRLLENGGGDRRAMTDAIDVIVVRRIVTNNSHAGDRRAHYMWVPRVNTAVDHRHANAGAR